MTFIIQDHVKKHSRQHLTNRVTLKRWYILEQIRLKIAFDAVDWVTRQSGFINAAGLHHWMQVELRRVLIHLFLLYATSFYNDHSVDHLFGFQPSCK